MTTVVTRSVPLTGIQSYVWNLVDGETGDDITPSATQLLASSVIVTGVFGGAVISLEYTNDGINWITAEDVRGDAATFTAASYTELSASVLSVRPVVTGGSGVNVKVALIGRG